MASSKKSAVTKSELIEQIAEQLRLTTGKAEQIVNTIFDSMVRALQEGSGIEIRGFGSFTVRDYKAYEGRNPRTGATVHVAPKRLPFFKVGKDLRERVNAAYQRELSGQREPDASDSSFSSSSSSSSFSGSGAGSSFTATSSGSSAPSPASGGAPSSASPATSTPGGGSDGPSGSSSGY